MISIAEAISDLLYVRDTVVVPGLGAFVKKPVSAQVNPVANYFAMPSSEIVFDANLREDNELVVNYMSEKNDIPKEEAQKLLSMFVSDCFNSLKQGKKVVLSQIGTLSYDWANDIVFEQDKSVNYNADAFGLCDFTPEPVLRSKTKDEIKTEIEQQQKDKNTPMSVDEKAVHERDNDDEDDEPRRGLGWLWVLLGLLLVAGVVYGLYYFKVIELPWQKEERRIVTEPKTYTLPTYQKTWEWKESVAQDTTVVNDTVKQPVATPSDANIRIIAGCFGLEDNAQRLTNTLKEKGYSGALYEMRYNMWYVSFGCYKTDEEAAAALREIRANTEYKAWILSQ
ncbi:MAG: SPOR domain-containing protein [Bacteroidales bacterium]|nr:SPOR domain-containing protein [Bacteroidales bacterium]